MTNEEMVKKIKELLKTDGDFDFLLGLRKKDLESLLASIRGRVDQMSDEKRHHRTRK